MEINKKSSSYLCDHTIKFVIPKFYNIQCRVSGDKIHEKHSKLPNPNELRLFISIRKYSNMLNLMSLGKFESYIRRYKVCCITYEFV